MSNQKNTITKQSIQDNKYESFMKYVLGKEVLDCGCVGTFEFEKFQPNHLHPLIAKHAKFVLGVDFNVEGIRQLKDLGFNVVVGDVEKDYFGQEFDVVIAGDLLEHLSNVGLFLENSKRHLKQNGILVIHTPNAFGITRFYNMLIKNDVEVNPDHICYYDMKTINQLLTRHGYEIIESRYTNTLSPKFIKKWIINSFIKLRNGFADSIFITARLRTNY